MEWSSQSKWFFWIVGIAAAAIETKARHGFTWHTLTAFWIGASVGYVLGTISIARRPMPWTKEGIEELARAFHETYERLAPNFGYKTRKESAVPWEQVPENNRNLMIATVEALIAERKL